jgi:spore coat polysaccharide biosynthesis predicted glycosyltransferase SpsG
MGHVLFRLNIGTKLGLGHFFRCKYLALEFQKRGYKCDFITDNKHSVYNNFKNINCHYLYGKKKFLSEKKDLNLTLKYLKKNTQFLILDDYRFKNIWIKNFKKKNKKIKLIVFDDNHLKNTKADYIINASKDCLDENFATRGIKLYGPKYSIINPKLKRAKEKSSKFEILLYFGGGFNYKTYHKEIREILINLKNLNNRIRINCIVGPLSKNFKKIKRNLKSSNIKFYENIYDLKEILMRSDFYIGSASSILYELNYLRIPSIIFTLNTKQKNIKNNFFEKLGNYFILELKDLKHPNIFDLLRCLLKNVKKIKKNINTREICIKKNGTKNIVDLLTNVKPTVDELNINKKKLKNKSYFQKAKLADINEFLEIRNYKKNRTVSANIRKISRVDHYIWWLKEPIEKFKFTDKNFTKIIFWRKKIFFKNFFYYTGGWSTSNYKVNLNEIIYGYKKMLETKKNLKWLGITKKSNKFLTWLNLKIGFSIVKQENLSIQIKQFLKIIKIKNYKKFNIFSI